MCSAHQKNNFLTHRHKFPPDPHYCFINSECSEYVKCRRHMLEEAVILYSLAMKIHWIKICVGTCLYKNTGCTVEKSDQNDQIFVTLYHKPRKDQFGFIANLETLYCEFQKDVSFEFTAHH